MSEAEKGVRILNDAVRSVRWSFEPIQSIGRDRVRHVGRGRAEFVEMDLL